MSYGITALWDVKTAEPRGDVYRITSRHGTYDIEKDRVERIEKGPAAESLYRLEKKRNPDTADGQFALAQWCATMGLWKQRKAHLARVIELEPDHADARQALGYIRKDESWVLKRSPKAPTDEEREQKREARRREAELRKVVSGWFVKVRAIHEGRLKSKANDAARRQFADGRQQILAIRDPLAIEPISKTLAGGDEPTRRLLVEALDRFREDEATMNLLVVALLDASPEVRRAAGDALARRKDDRVVDSLRLALYSERESTIRNAASALGRLKAVAAVEDLVRVLSIQTVQTVRTTDPLFLDSIYYIFGRPIGVAQSGGLIFYRPYCIAAYGPGALIGTVDRYEPAVVDVHRTEVQEALIAITGKNFGFDAVAWLRWHRGR
jgi:hypothetical protein